MSTTCIPVRNLTAVERVNAVVNAKYGAALAATSLYTLAEAENVQAVREALYAAAARIREAAAQVDRWYDIETSA